jgi:hypothetical protein
MPMDRSRYPANWEDISRRIRERAGNRCEWCGVPNGAWGYRDKTGRFWTEEEIAQTDGDHPFNNYEPKPLRIVLTVAHLGVTRPDGASGDKHDKMDVRDENLAALCQRCHINYDRDEHSANAAATRRRKREQAGQLPLMEV